MIENIRIALAELLETRRHIDADIADLQRIIDRHGKRGAIAPGVTPRAARVSKRRSGTPKAHAQLEILEIMSDGRPWSPSALARRRNKTPAATGAALRRLVEDGKVKRLGEGRYKIVPPQGGATASVGETNGAGDTPLTDLLEPVRGADAHDPIAERGHTVE